MKYFYAAILMSCKTFKEHTPQNAELREPVLYYTKGVIFKVISCFRIKLC